VTDFRPYRRKRSYLLAIVIILLAIFVSYSVLLNKIQVRAWIETIFYPFQVITAAAWKSTVGFPAFVMNLGDLVRENAKLKETLQETNAKLIILDQLAEENARLKEALDFKRTQNRFNLRAAGILGRVPATWYSILLIDKGSKDGLSVGMTAINQQGLIGKIIEVSSFSSKVLLLIDHESAVVAADARSRVEGVVEGSGTEKLFMKYVGVGGDIKEGDLIVTSPISSLFPAGLPIGTVSRATKREHDIFYYIEIKPLVQFFNIETLFVII